MLLCALFLGSFSASAESTVYVFLKSMSNTDTSVSVDGKQVCNLNGPVKRTLKPGFGLILPFETLESCYRKLVFSEEGKKIITFSVKYTNATNGNISTYKGEISLDLEDGESYYVEVTNKGLNDMQLKSVEEKKATKWLKKWTALQTITIE